VTERLFFGIERYLGHKEAQGSPQEAQKLSYELIKKF
jgi:hypothetical protein